MLFVQPVAGHWTSRGPSNCRALGKGPTRPCLQPALDLQSWVGNAIKDATIKSTEWPQKLPPFCTP